MYASPKRAPNAAESERWACSGLAGSGAESESSPVAKRGSVRPRRPRLVYNAGTASPSRSTDWVAASNLFVAGCGRPSDRPFARANIAASAVASERDACQSCPRRCATQAAHSVSAGLRFTSTGVSERGASHRGGCRAASSHGGLAIAPLRFRLRAPSGSSAQPATEASPRSAASSASRSRSCSASWRFAWQTEAIEGARFGRESTRSSSSYATFASHSLPQRAASLRAMLAAEARASDRPVSLATNRKAARALG
mmetsp:Transcript_34725/g.115070  ORF Transcript_34725/g.115070 Transcript_34725/m.115070 type:complete len:255 (-) Transcript_34725:93-857(-)